MNPENMEQVRYMIDEAVQRAKPAVGTNIHDCHVAICWLAGYSTFFVLASAIAFYAISQYWRFQRMSK